MLSESLTPCTATHLTASRHKSSSITSDEFNALLPPSSTTSEKSNSSSRHSLNSNYTSNYPYQPGSATNYSHQQQHYDASLSSSSSATMATGSPSGAGAAAAALSASQLGGGGGGVGGNGSDAVGTANSAGRSAALERAYVHDVYEHCEEPAGTIRPRVAQFLAGLEAGSMVCDVGCGNGRYLNANPLCFTLGVERCARLATGVREDSGNGGGGGGGGGEVALCDNLDLPFRDESFDAVLSVAVVHHFATTERRIGAIRELARVLRIGGRVIITVWALEQKQRRFESQDVLIPWQQPKSRSSNLSDEDEDDEFLPPYHAYTEDSTNSSRSAGDGDSSSLSSSSPGESCYSFVRRAIQKLAGTGRRHPWFLDTWTSKDTKNGNSLDYEDAKDLPIELRRLEDFDDFTAGLVGGGGGGGSGCVGGVGDVGIGRVGGSIAAVDTNLTAGLKSRSLGSIMYPPPPPRPVVRSRSSVPSLGSFPVPENVAVQCSSDTSNMANANAVCTNSNHVVCAAPTNKNILPPVASTCNNIVASVGSMASTTTTAASSTAVSSYVTDASANATDLPASETTSSPVNTASRRPRLVKQKQSLCDDEQTTATRSFVAANTEAADTTTESDSNIATLRPPMLRKQSSLNEELMAENRIRERERVKKRIQKQTSLNEAHLTRSAVFSRKFQTIRDGLTTKLKTSGGSLERATKSSLARIMQSVKISTGQTCADSVNTDSYQQHRHPHHTSLNGTFGGRTFGHIRVPWAGIVRQSSTPPQTPPFSSSPSTIMTASTNSTIIGSNSGGSMDAGDGDAKERRHSRESGSDSSKDSLQSDTSIESEDSFASVIFIPKSELLQQKHQQQQQMQQMQQPANDIELPATAHSTACLFTRTPSMPTSPLVMPCPTPAHSPAPPRCCNNMLYQQAAGVASKAEPTRFPFENVQQQKVDTSIICTDAKLACRTEVNSTKTDAANVTALPPSIPRLGQHIPITYSNTRNNHQYHYQFDAATSKPFTASIPIASNVTSSSRPIVNSAANLQPHSRTERITRQVVKNLPQIPKFRRHASINYPIVRRVNSNTPAVPKLSSMELFNPATDDLDSDSSEPSSPDSIDSVISAFKPPVSATTTTTTTTSASSDGSGKATAAITPEPNSSVASTTAAVQPVPSNEVEPAGNTLKVVMHKHKPDSIRGDSFDDSPERTTATTAPNANDTSAIDWQSPPQSHSRCCEHAAPPPPPVDRNELVAFAAKLSAQLLKEMDNGRASHVESDGEYCDDNTANDDDDRFQRMHRSVAVAAADNRGASRHKPMATEDPYIRKLNGELKDLHSLREELRERRLMLANLNIAQYQNSSTIEEEDESPRADGDDEPERPAGGTTGVKPNEEPDSDSRKGSLHGRMPLPPFGRSQPQRLSSIDTASSQDDITSILNSNDNLSVATAEAVAMSGGIVAAGGAADGGSMSPSSVSRSSANAQRMAAPMESRPSVDSWAHSNSTASLESPSAGGSSTHHRYYHVFREGELEALINHHVTSLHIVSSYYERASWCVIAEKVQVWSI